MSARIIQGDCTEMLKTLPDESVHCCVTSPPYWGLRDYGVSGQLGLERTPEEYVSKMVAVFREVKRVLRSDGTLWLNIGDSYAANGSGGLSLGTSTLQGGQATQREAVKRPAKSAPNLKPKDLVGIPWLLAFALRADGWYLRQDIIWAKPNPMPESVTDRCTKSHEYIFLLSKSQRYYYDQDAIAEPVAWPLDLDRESPPKFGGNKQCPDTRLQSGKEYKRKDFDKKMGGGGSRIQGHSGGICADGTPLYGDTRNKRSVWSVQTRGYSDAHFATFPTELIEPCIKAGCQEGGTVLDPFSGAGTTGLVATRFNRNYIGIELNPEYIAMSTNRIVDDAPLFNSVSEFPTEHGIDAASSGVNEGASTTETV